MKIKMIILTIILALSALISCTSNTEPPVIEPNTLKLTLVDVSVTEAYLHINIGNIRNDEDIVLLRDGKEVLSFKNTRKDTILTDTSLTENTAYSYTVTGRMSGRESGKSNEVAVTTLQPTSHNFTWETFYFGDLDYCNCNILHDVTIVDENNIWAVGEMYFKDSLGNVDSQIYGAIHWDGVKWTPVKVPVRDINIPPYPNKIFTISSVKSDIYVADYANLLRLENNKWAEVAFFAKSIPFNGQVQHMWAKDETSIYCAGWNGSVYHVKGNTWRQIDAGTKTEIMDIWGMVDKDSNKEKVYLAVSSYTPYYGNTDKKIIIIENGEKIDSIRWNNSPYVNSVWTNNGFPIYATGIGIFSNKSGSFKSIEGIPDYIFTTIRGTSLNNIFAAGNYGRLMSYNGLTWEFQHGAYLANGGYSSIAVKDNIVAIVGITDDGKAVITIGRR